MTTRGGRNGERDRRTDARREPADRTEREARAEGGVREDRSVWEGSRPYWWTFGGLVVLTSLTLALTLIGVGGWGPPLALGIGAAKALLVVLFFMHLTEHRTSSRISFTTAAAFAAVLIGLTVLDVGTRERDRYMSPAGEPTESGTESGAPPTESAPSGPGGGEEEGSGADEPGPGLP